MRQRHPVSPRKKARVVAIMREIHAAWDVLWPLMLKRQALYMELNVHLPDEPVPGP